MKRPLIMYYIVECPENKDQMNQALAKGYKIRNIRKFDGRIDSFMVDKAIIASEDLYGVSEVYKQAGIPVEDISQKPHGISKMDAITKKEAQRMAKSVVRKRYTKEEEVTPVTLEEPIEVVAEVTPIVENPVIEVVKESKPKRKSHKKRATRKKTTRKTAKKAEDVTQALDALISGQLEE